MSHRRLFAVMVACGALGLVLMIVFPAPVTRVFGVLALFAFIVIGVFLIADPATLARDDDAAE